MPDLTREFDPDLFVAWLAEVGSGSIDRLRTDITWAAGTKPIDASNWVYSLEELGFIRLDWVSRRWTAEPLTATSLPGKTKVALLAGARPALQYWADVPGVVVHRHTEQVPIKLPSTVWFEGLEAEETVLGLAVLASAAERAARSLSFLELGDPAPGPSRHTELAHFDKRSARFGMPRKISNPEDGLYEYQLHGRVPRYAFYKRQQWYGIDRREGIHLALPDRAFPLRWHADPGPRGWGALGQLLVDLRTPLPRTHQAAAILCTGLPRLKSGEYSVYDGVPLWIAEKISVSLRRKLEVPP